MRKRPWLSSLKKDSVVADKVEGMIDNKIEFEMSRMPKFEDQNKVKRSYPKVQDPCLGLLL